MAAASICYLSTNVTNLLFPDYEQYKSTIEKILSLPMAAGELGFAIWLLVKGWKLKLHAFQNSFSEPA